MSNTTPTPQPGGFPLNPLPLLSRGLSTALQKLPIPENSMKQFLMDLLGVWAPKIPMSRSKEQLAEDAFLENIENGAFYFTIPLTAPLIAKGISSLYGQTKDMTPEQKQAWINKIGTSWDELGKGIKTDAGKGLGKMETYLQHGGKEATHLLGPKLGTLIGVLTLAGGYEYMIQHAKNVMIAKGFGTRNFTAVAGLEGKQNQAAEGEMDPVEKAKRRTFQIGALMGTGFALAAFTPLLVTKFKTGEKVAKKVLEVCNFNKGFDITKPILATIAGIGAVSYVDAARDHFERKETGSRLLLVIPYMLFGKELAGNALAWGANKLKVNVNGQKKAINELADGKFSLLKGGFKDSLKQAATKENFLQLDMSKKAEDITKALKGMDQDVIDAVIKRNKWVVGRGSFLLGALVCGVGINWMSYQQTKSRYNKEQEQKQQLNQTQQAKPQLGRTVFQSYGGFAAQGKPLEDPASAAVAAPRRVQTPFQQGARQSVNPYGYGQWRV